MIFKDALSRQLGRLDSLDTRERTVLKVLILFLGVLAFYLSIWSPAHRYYEASLIKRDTAFALLQYMRASEPQARAASGTKKRRSSSQSLITDISNAAKEQGIQPNRIQPEGSTAVMLWFDGVLFNDLMGWLVLLHGEYGVSVEQISVDRQIKSGLVTARVLLST